ncbi:MAG: PEP-CTERM sorting domain-containing protein [Pseudomonadota bacterium]
MKEGVYIFYSSADGLHCLGRHAADLVSSSIGQALRLTYVSGGPNFPEPGTLMLLLIGLLYIAWARKPS